MSNSIRTWSRWNVLKWSHRCLTSLLLYNYSHYEWASSENVKRRLPFNTNVSIQSFFFLSLTLFLNCQQSTKRQREWKKQPEAVQQWTLWMSETLVWNLHSSTHNRINAVPYRQQGVALIRCSGALEIVGAWRCWSPDISHRQLVYKNCYKTFKIFKADENLQADQDAEKTLTCGTFSLLGLNDDQQKILSVLKHEQILCFKLYHSTLLFITADHSWIFSFWH